MVQTTKTAKPEDIKGLNIIMKSLSEMVIENKKPVLEAYVSQAYFVNYNLQYEAGFETEDVKIKIQVMHKGKKQ